MLLSVISPISKSSFGWGHSLSKSELPQEKFLMSVSHWWDFDQRDEIRWELSGIFKEGNPPVNGKHFAVALHNTS